MTAILLVAFVCFVAGLLIGITVAPTVYEMHAAYVLAKCGAAPTESDEKP